MSERKLNLVMVDDDVLIVRILEHIVALQEVDVTGVPATAQVTALATVMRPDEVTEGLSREAHLCFVCHSGWVHTSPSSIIESSRLPMPCTSPASLAPKATRQERDKFARQILANPRNYMAQPLVALSTAVLG